MAGLTLRKNADSLTPEELQGLREAYRKAQAIMDNRGYNYYAGLHGIPNWFCWHHDHVQGSTVNANLFLPWHRAYLLYFERAIRDQAPAGAKLGLPWWDWSSLTSHTTGVPVSFSVPTANGQPNPLYRARIVAPTSNPPINRLTRRYPRNPAQLPSKQNVVDLLNLSQYNDFSTQLEGYHDGIHGWTGGNSGGSNPVGGDMGTVSTAAWDPIFWSHHCMIDRLWYLWQTKHGINNIPPALLGMSLRPFALTVNDVLSVNALGYEYAVTLIQF